MPELAHDRSYHDPHVGHEESDMTMSAGVIFGVLLVVLCIGCYLAVIVTMHVFAGQRAAQEAHAVTYPLQQELPMAVGPGVQANPPADLATLRAEENAVLGSYAWVSREDGIVRIPIAAAMQLVVKQGLPARPTPPPQEGPQYPEASSSGRMMEQLVP